MKCPDKVRYKERDSANAARRHREPAAGQRLYVYKCDGCGLFHLTKRRITNEQEREAIKGIAALRKAMYDGRANYNGGVDDGTPRADGTGQV